jgi:PAS domain S-box-containing protein
MKKNRATAALDEPRTPERRAVASFFPDGHGALRWMLDEMDDGVTVENAAYDIEYANPASVRDFGPYAGRKCYHYFHGRETPCPWCRNRDMLPGKSSRWQWASVRSGKTYDLVKTALTNPDGSMSMLSIFRDVTEIRRAQAREAEAVARAAAAQAAVDMLDAMGEGVMLLDLQGVIVAVNPAIEAMTGLSKAELVGLPTRGFFPVFLPPEERAAVEALLAEALRGNLSSVPPITLLARGERIHVAPEVKFVRGADRRPTAIVLTLRDVTGIHQYQQRLLELTERLAVDEEEDRWRISRYIHDAVIQNLSLANIRLGAIGKQVRDAGRNEEFSQVEQVRGLLGQAMDECRQAMSDLTPALLYELGLIPALQDLARQLAARHGTRIVVAVDGQEPPLPNPLRGLLFEAVRELIVNAIKHAGPGSIHVSARCRADELAIDVADDGSGFDPTAALQVEHHGGFGLFNIRQRLEGLGGRLEIASAPGKGATMSIRVPLEKGNLPEPARS